MRLAMLLPAMLALAATDTGPLPESLRGPAASGRATCCLVSRDV